jgi:hypothetical protein
MAADVVQDRLDYVRRDAESFAHAGGDAAPEIMHRPRLKLHARGSKASIQLLFAVGPTAKTTVREHEVAVALHPAGENGLRREGKRDEVRPFVFHPIGRQQDHAVPDFVKPQPADLAGPAAGQHQKLEDCAVCVAVAGPPYRRKLGDRQHPRPRRLGGDVRPDHRVLLGQTASDAPCKER